MSEQYLDMKTGKMKCRVCGEEFDLQLPQDVNLVAAVAKAFSKVHKKCKNKK